MKNGNSLYTKVFMLLAAFCMLACGSSQNELSGGELTVITVDESATTQIKDLVYDYKIIELENTLEASISEIRNMYIIDDKIYCYNIDGAGSVLVFDMGGKLLNKIEHVGRAKNEWVRLSSCTIDQEQKLIVLVDYDANKILEYSLDGEFINSYKTPDLNKFEIISLDDKFVVVTTPRTTGWKIDQGSDYKINIYSKDGSLITKQVETKFNPSSLNPDSFFEISKSFDGSTIYCPLLDNTVYKIGNDTVTPYLQFLYNGDKKSYTAQELDKAAAQRQFLSGTDGTVFYGSSFLETKDLIYRRIGSYEAFDVLYNKNSKKSTVVQFNSPHLGAKGISKSILYPKPVTCYNDRFYAPFSIGIFNAPKEFVKDDMPEELVPYMRKYQNGELNNIIVTYKLKDVI